MNTRTPAVPEGHYADLGDGLTIHYHAAGPADGPAVMFLHGSGPGATGYSNFKGNFPYFAERGLRCIVPDTLGYGYSSKPTDVVYTLEWLVDGARRLCDALGIAKLSLVGNSMGGAMAIRFALTHPDMVDRLVLMAPGGLEEREVYLQMRGIKRMLRSIYGPEGLTREGMRKVFELQLYEPGDIAEATIDERYEIAMTQPIEVFKTLRVGHLAPQLKDLSCPVFCLWGRDDQFCPVSGAQRVAEQVPDARVLTLSRCGHWVMVEHAELFNRWSVDFLMC